MEENQNIWPSLALLSVIATFLLLVFLGGAVAILIGEIRSMVVIELLVAAIPLGVMLSKKINIRKYINLQLTPKNVLLGIAYGFLLLVFDVSITIILTSIFGPSEAIEKSSERLLDATSTLDGLIFVVAGLAAAGICEEFTFRGFFQTTLSKKYPVWLSIIASSVMFGLFHLDPQLIYTLSAFSIGLLLGYIYHSLRSYTVVATAHTAVNLIVLTIQLLAR